MVDKLRIKLEQASEQLSLAGGALAVSKHDVRQAVSQVKDWRLCVKDSTDRLARARAALSAAEHRLEIIQDALTMDAGRYNGSVTAINEARAELENHQEKEGGK